jgi:hypothetical protein
MNIHKYDHTKGSKAFSYFSVVAKNYLILHNNNNYKKYKTHDDINLHSDTIIHDDKEKINHLTDLLTEVVRYFEFKIPSLFNKDKDRKIAYAVLELISNRNDIENFNKKFLYILIREMTDAKTSEITKVSNVFRKHYPKLLNRFEREGMLLDTNEIHPFF